MVSMRFGFPDRRRPLLDEELAVFLAKLQQHRHPYPAVADFSTGWRVGKLSRSIGKY